MSRRFITALSAVMYFVSFASFFCLIGIDIIPKEISHLVKFITTFLTFSCGYAASAIFCYQKKDKEFCSLVMGRTFKFLFCAYVLIVIDFMLIDTGFGREISNIFRVSSEDISEYLRENTNLIPFATIRLFFRGYHNNWLTLSAFTENIMGNIVVFMPLAIFIPLITKRFNSTLKFFLMVSAVVICMEILQILLLTGAADVDDYILNVAGAMLAYAILRIPKISKLFNSISFGTWRYEN